jgi:hypothetical protein
VVSAIEKVIYYFKNTFNSKFHLNGYMWLVAAILDSEGLIYSPCFT